MFPRSIDISLLASGYCTLTATIPSGDCFACVGNHMYFSAKAARGLFARWKQERAGMYRRRRGRTRSQGSLHVLGSGRRPSRRFDWDGDKQTGLHSVQIQAWTWVQMVISDILCSRQRPQYSHDTKMSGMRGAGVVQAFRDRLGRAGPGLSSRMSRIASA